jgi:hypothetical protein
VVAVSGTDWCQWRAKHLSVLPGHPSLGILTLQGPEFEDDANEPSRFAAKLTDLQGPWSRSSSMGKFPGISRFWCVHDSTTGCPGLG